MKEKFVFSLVALAVLAAKPGSAQPAIFNPEIEKNCILSWFEMSPDNTTDDLAVAYNKTEPLRLAAVLNSCGIRAGRTDTKRCDEMCAAEVQVNVEMHRREGKAQVLRDVERLR